MNSNQNCAECGVRPLWFRLEARAEAHAWNHQSGSGQEVLFVARGYFLQIFEEPDRTTFGSHEAFAHVRLPDHHCHLCFSHLEIPRASAHIIASITYGFSIDTPSNVVSGTVIYTSHRTETYSTSMNLPKRSGWC
jgi:hypothetical protein